MRIATLQFSPQLGDVEANIRRADQLLKLTTSNASDEPGIVELQPDILVLPEMAFSGYNFPSLQAIKPYLEIQNEGPSAEWAKRTALRLKCKVCVGYPEVFREKSTSEDDSIKSETYYNSLLVVDEMGQFLHNYRKRFLYFTDMSWASEGQPEWSFKSLEFNTSSTRDSHGYKLDVPTTFGICMDINPYKFEAPFTAFEFANRVLDSQSHMVVIPTAFLVNDATTITAVPEKLPHMETFNYWLQRFWPLIEKKIDYSTQLEEFSTPTENKIILVFANRSGVEEGKEPVPTATYAGTSCILTIKQTIRSDGITKWNDETRSSFDVKIDCWDIKGAREEGICFADTRAEPKMTFVTKPRSENDSDENAAE
ncbi:carbon-nitrogen hydrolase [Talaromyces proteolyticus]|uniref:Carbon-nitrogen hydrolase n=1 Tax=Talaromyces proteolyticus TaxID=1131652 RepID=A0AAD4Q412_9EURO|nr:carbon-nitrogen hydrolase [Talaromyces proteolyticus]KAH8702383.1 carbon-nitrogen hydrolase [Talaromyces proteolyticus]